MGQLAVTQTLGAKKSKRDEASVLESTQPDVLLRQALEAAGQGQAAQEPPKERPEPVPQGTLMKVQQKHADAAQPEPRKVQALPQVQQSVTQPPKKSGTRTSIVADDGPSFEPSINISVDNSLSLQLGTPQGLGTSLRKLAPLPPPAQPVSAKSEPSLVIDLDEPEAPPAPAAEEKQPEPEKKRRKKVVKKKRVAPVE